jgi:hypothetical protein
MLNGVEREQLVANLRALASRIERGSVIAQEKDLIVDITGAILDELAVGTLTKSMIIGGIKRRQQVPPSRRG